MLRQESVPFAGQRGSSLTFAGIQGLAFLGNQAREEAEHEPQMVVGLPMQSFDLKAVTTVDLAHSNNVLAEHVSVRLHVE